MDPVRSGRQYLDLWTLLPAVVNECFGVLKILVLFDSFTVKTPLIKRGSVGSGDNADLSSGNDRRRSDRYPKKIRVDRPFARRQHPKLNTLYAALLNERYRVLKIVVRI